MEFSMDSIEIPSIEVDGIKYTPRFDSGRITAAANYRPHDDDIVLSTYPKSGTTWTQYIICHLLHYGEFKGDCSEIVGLCPFIDLHGTAFLKPGDFYKTHLPFNPEAFNPKAKYILVFRDPRDVAVSYYHHANKLPGIPGIPKDFNWFERYADLFVKGQTWYGDYFKHVNGWLEGTQKYGDNNVHVVIYEKMKKQPKEEIIRIANFLGGKPAKLVNDEKIVESILESTSVDAMRTLVNPGMTAMLKHTNKLEEDSEETFEFIRKGEVGDHVNYFTPRISAEFDSWIKSDPKHAEIMEMFQT